MLLHRCKCGTLIPQELRLCPDCEAKESDKVSRHMEYNLRRRNKKAAAFYVSAEWRKVRAFALSLYDSLDMDDGRGSKGNLRCADRRTSGGRRLCWLDDGEFQKSTGRH